MMATLAFNELIIHYVVFLQFLKQYMLAEH